ncbi:nucleoside phosphorylase [Oceanotoga teriensis]|uniref:Nucleoside phosphorylase n=1 Tax=Oceanotoga teriensis TaxID=515440 RepID=A0AA45C5D1_9BACT|nr:hypothetical protein [Oceanotoga teriensis]PWJ88716.1 nucleoside phosphorylase [Oceanotoga teriensis]
MLYIVTALKFEALPIIKKYNLKKTEDKMKIYKNENITLIISGIGKINSAISVAYLKNNKNDKILNIGIAATSNSKIYKKDEIYLINEIYDEEIQKNYYPEIFYEINELEGKIVTKSRIQKEKIKYPIMIDMESSGFYQSAKKFYKSENIFIIKYISDILEETIDYEVIKKNYINNFEKIIKIIEILIKNDEKIEDIENIKDKIKQIVEKTSFTKYQKLELKNLLTYHYLKYKNIPQLKSSEISEKRERNKLFYEIKKEII